MFSFKDKPTENAGKAKVLKRLVNKGKVVICKDNSETIASMIHLFLMLQSTKYEKPKFRRSLSARFSSVFKSSDSTEF